MSSSFFVVIVYVQFCIILVKWFYKQKIQIIKFGYHFSLYNTHLVYLIIGKNWYVFYPFWWCFMWKANFKKNPFLYSSHMMFNLKIWSTTPGNYCCENGCSEYRWKLLCAMNCVLSHGNPTSDLTNISILSCGDDALLLGQCLMWG